MGRTKVRPISFTTDLAGSRLRTRDLLSPPQMLQRRVLNDSAIWKSLQDTRRLTLIAGPCVIESEKLCFEVAAALKILSRAVGSTILSASNSVQEALEGYKDHGLFTWVVAEGLKGAADSDKDGYVKTHELVDYVDSQVPELAEQVFRHKQYPTTTLSGQGFPVARVK